MMFGFWYGSFRQSSWCKGISETKSKWQSPCNYCMHQPVTSQANACTSHAYGCMCCMHCPMTSQADACSYCMGSVVLILSRIYLYLQLLWAFVIVNHRYLKNIDCLSFVMRLLLPPHLPRYFCFFLQQPIIVLIRQTRQVVRTINQSIFP